MAGTPLARPTDAPPTAHRPAAAAADALESPAEPARDRLLPDADLPRHVAIIMDGNRRWAAARGLPVIAGHVQGVEAIRPVVRIAPDRGIEVLSLYVFSRENWRRSEDEVTGLLGLIDGAVRQHTDELVAQGVRVRVIGRLHELALFVHTVGHVFSSIRSIFGRSRPTPLSSSTTSSPCISFRSTSVSAIRSIAGRLRAIRA